MDPSAANDTPPPEPAPDERAAAAVPAPPVAPSPLPPCGDLAESPGLLAGLRPAILIFAAALYIFSVAVLTPPPHLPPEALKAPEPPVVAEPAATPEKLAPLPQETPWWHDPEMDQLPDSAKAVMGGLVLLWLTGGGVFIGLAIGYFTTPAWRERFPLRREGPPLRPAVLAWDLIALLVLGVAAVLAVNPLILQAWAFAAGRFDYALLLLLSLLAQFTGYVAVIAGAVFAMRMRAGVGGSAGFWPFWKFPGAAPERALASDAALGVATYLLCYWMILLAALANVILAKQFGWTVEQNPLLDLLKSELAGDRRWWLILGLTLGASLGAAVFEELIFRGILYNVCKRHFGHWAGTFLSSAAFAAVHRNPSQALPLFVLSLLLTYNYERTGRLVAPMVLHGLNNTIALCIVIWSHTV